MSAAALRLLPDLWSGNPQPRGTVPPRVEQAAAARASWLPSRVAGLPAPAHRRRAQPIRLRPPGGTVRFP